MKNENAFTLIEILISIAIMSLILTVIVAFLNSSHRISSISQEDTTMLQDIRMVNQIMAQELRMAGYELRPNWDPLALRTTNQITGDNSSINFYYVADNGLIDADGDGIADIGNTVQVNYRLNGTSIERTSANVVYNELTDTFSTIGTPVTQVMVTNVEALQFMYFWSNEADTGTWNAAPMGAAASGLADPVINRSVEISLVVRAERSDPKLTPEQRPFTAPFSNTQFFLSPNDQFRRRMATTIVNLRNMK